MTTENQEVQRREALCSEIVSCPTALNILQQTGASLSQHELRCAPVVLSQLMDKDCPPATGATPEHNANRWLLPEPWNGKLHTARLLFIGQNPSANFREDYPVLADIRAGSANKDLLNYFETRFDGSAIKDGTCVKLRHPENGSGYAKANRFLSRVKKIAEELYGRPVNAGDDYALTEGVRCKSKDAIGVHLAVDTCAARYMKETISLSQAQVIVCMGDVARRALLAGFNANAVLQSRDKRFGFGTLVPLSTFDKSICNKRQVLFLRHSSAFGKFGILDRRLVNRLRLLLTK